MIRDDDGVEWGMMRWVGRVEKHQDPSDDWESIGRGVN